MKATKQDKYGYCIYVQVDTIQVLKMSSLGFLESGFAYAWITRLINGDAKKPSQHPALIQGVYAQFSNPSIDIFVDEDGINKGLPSVALTSKGLVLFGSVVILGSFNGESILLTKKQTEIALKELGFYNHYEKVDFVDVTDESSLKNPMPKPLHDLIIALLSHCIEEDIQLLNVAEDLKSGGEVMALTMCIHGDRVLIHDCHQLVKDFIDSRHKGTSEHFEGEIVYESAKQDSDLSRLN